MNFVLHVVIALVSHGYYTNEYMNKIITTENSLFMNIKKNKYIQNQHNKFCYMLFSSLTLRQTLIVKK